MLSPKDLQRHQRASGIVPTSATYSQCHSVLDLQGYMGKEFETFFYLPGLNYLMALHFWTGQIRGENTLY